MTEHRICAAAAGPTGPKVRSDLNVAYEPAKEALAIAVSSKVDYLYGQAIREAVERVCDAFSVTTGRVTISDAGALEWVILARVETCLRRAGFTGEPVLPTAVGVPATSRERLRRSRLYLPGNQPKLVLSAGLYGADGLILDLEDSVPPAEKDSARVLVRNALIALDLGNSERMVRINQGATGEEDLRELAPCTLHTVLLPKVEEPAQVKGTGDILRKLANARPVPFLMPILESPLGISRAYEIAAADELVVALTLGLEDLSAELGAPRTAAGWESFLARQTTVYAARAAGVAPIASVYSDIADEQGLVEYVQRECGLGFDGIGCIHPRQIETVHRAMTPPAAQVDRAVRVVRAASEAEAKGLGVVALGSKMVDPPVVKQAFRTVRLAVAAGVLAANWEEQG